MRYPVNHPNAKPRRASPPAPASQRQRGVILFISLIVLVALALAGIALFRQVGTGVIIAGNLAFRENATSVSDLGLEAARTWLMAQSSGTLDDNVTPGYYACGLPAASCAQASFDPTTFDWTANSVQVTADDGTGNEVRYVIHRLCEASGTPTGGAAACVTVGAAGAGGSKGGGAYGVLPLASTVQPYFRITARAAGPRNTVSYVQSVMY